MEICVLFKCSDIISVMDRGRIRIKALPYACTFFLSILAAQDITVEGTVIDDISGVAVSGVNIFLADSDLGTVSDTNGIFSLIIPESLSMREVVFSYIGYRQQTIPVMAIKSKAVIRLEPTVIPMQQVGVTGTGRSLEIQKDIPQPISVIESKTFELRGFTDAGDLLRTDHTVQLNENISGKKTVNIRGGNADEVAILYNGVRMNSEFDNIFDIALVDLQNVDHLEVIRGSNSVLYGAEAFSGIINIVPKLVPEKTLSFNQHFGTYQSGRWSAHLGKKFDRFSSAYSLNRGAYFRQFEGRGNDESLENNSDQHNLTFTYLLDGNNPNEPGNQLSSTLLLSHRLYKDHRFNDSVENENMVTILHYSGAVGPLPAVSAKVSQHQISEDQNLAVNTGNLDRSLKSNANRFSFRSTNTLKPLEATSVLQLEQSDLDYRDHRSFSHIHQVGLESAQFSRTKIGAAVVAKLLLSDVDEGTRFSDVSVSVRRDKIIDSQKEAVLRGGFDNPELNDLGLFDTRSWDNTIMKFSTSLIGGSEKFAVRSYFNFGTSYKYPTLLQQISGTMLNGILFASSALNPEKNQNFELGLHSSRLITGSETLDAFDMTVNLFQNDYENKMRISYPIGIPVAFYDNIDFAKISGYEIKSTIHLFNRSTSADLALASYNIPEKGAFPFKSEVKVTANLNVDYKGWSLQVHGFGESEQIGWMRQDLGHLFEVTLPSHKNVDIHLSKSIHLRNLEGFANLSGYNLRNKSTVLEGLILRDRRIYFSFGFKL